MKLSLLIKTLIIHVLFHLITTFRNDKILLNKQALNNNLLNILKNYENAIKEQNLEISNILTKEEEQNTKFNSDYFSDFSFKQKINKEEINKSEEKGQIKGQQLKHLKYDINNRFILINPIGNEIIDKNDNYQVPISSILNHKAVIKMDNGKFNTFIIIKYRNKEILFYDIRDSLLFKQAVDFEIIKITNFISNEETFIYCLVKYDNNDYSVVKYSIEINSKKLFNKSENESDECSSKSAYECKGNSLLVNTFKENNNQYELNFHYNKNKLRYVYSLRVIGIVIINKSESEANSIVEKYHKHENKTNDNLQITKLSLDESDALLDIKVYLSKGKRYLIIESKKAFNFIKDFSFHLKEQFTKTVTNQTVKDFTAFLGFFALFYKNNNENQMEIRNFNDPQRLSLLITLKDDEVIESFCFDQFNNLFYLLTAKFNLYIISPKIVSRDIFEKNSYEILKVFDLKDKYKESLSKISKVNKFSMEVIRKDLVINLNSDFIFISLEDFSNSNSNSDEMKDINFKDIPSKIFNLSFYNNCNKIEAYYMTYTKTPTGNYLLLNTVKDDSQHSLLFYEVQKSNSSLIGEESFSFNFKIPVILISLIILVIYHFVTKKKDNQLEDEDKKTVRDELLKELRSQGAFKQSVKDDRKINKSSSKTKMTNFKEDYEGDAINEDDLEYDDD